MTKLSTTTKMAITKWSRKECDRVSKQKIFAGINAWLPFSIYTDLAGGQYLELGIAAHPMNRCDTTLTLNPPQEI